MKRKLLLSISLFLAFSAVLMAQVPQGMNYQAVARDKEGHEIANKKISLKVSLHSTNSHGNYYTETHSAVTNQFGLFSLVIGEGTPEKGTFTDVPWSTAEIWMDASVKNEGETEYTPLGSSKLYAVPYAFFAGKAADVTGTSGTSATNQHRELLFSQCPCKDGIKSITFLYLGPSGVTINVYNDYHLQATQLIQSFAGVNDGAILTINVPAALGGVLKDLTYFQYVGAVLPVQTVPTKCTNYNNAYPPSVGETFGNISVISQTDKNNSVCTACNADGAWFVAGNAVLDACAKLGTLTNTDLTIITNNTPRVVVSKTGDVNVNNNLSIAKDLHVGANAFLNEGGGSTTNKGPFSVTNNSPTYLTGTLTADNAVLFNNTLTVMGNTGLKGNLNVYLQKPTDLTGTLTVGKATQLNSTLGVAGNTDLQGYLHVNNGAPTVLSGTLQDYDNAYFDQHVTLTNASLNSNSTTTGALVVAGGTGIGQSLYVGGPTFLRSTLWVDGNTDLWGYLHVGNQSPTHLTGTLETDLDATFHQHVTLDNGAINSSDSSNGALHVVGGVGIEKNLNVGGIATFSGPVNFKNVVTISNTTQSTDYTNGALVVAGGIGCAKNLNVNGEVVITDNHGSGGSDAFPLWVKGKTQGLKIQVTGNDGGTPNMSNNFIQFVNDAGTQSGTISGETVADLSNDAGYITEEAFLAADLVMASADLAVAIADQIAADASTTPCVGLGVCETVPIPSFIVSTAFALGVAIANEAIAAANITQYTVQYQQGLPGIIFNSGSGDYAEWLPKANPDEKIYRGDIVGVKGGLISKSTEGAEKLMVVSTLPIVLGNTPPKGKESLYEKVAFIGQVQTKVWGKVEAGDYILAAEGSTGFGRAKKAEDMEPADYQRIVGMAWGSSSLAGLNYVNTAVGLSTNDVARLTAKQDAKIKAQANEINELKAQMNHVNDALAKLVPGYNVTPLTTQPASKPTAKGNTSPEPAQGALQALPTGVHYNEISRSEFDQGIDQAAEALRKAGSTPQNNIFLKKLEDQSYKDQLFAQVLEKVKLQIEKSKQIDQHGTH